MLHNFLSDEKETVVARVVVLQRNTKNYVDIYISLYLKVRLYSQTEINGIYERDSLENSTFTNIEGNRNM